MMSAAVPLQDDALQVCILKLYHTAYTLDPYQDRLMSQGYQVVNADSYEEALRLAHDCRPALIMVYDDPTAQIDASQWLYIQHSDRFSWMAMTPLLILADAERSRALRFEELPDRVVVLQRRQDTLNQLTRTVKRLLRINRADM